MKLPIKLCHPKAVIPEFQTDGAACFDIVAVSREIKGNSAIYDTGLKFQVPNGYFLEVFSRSSHGFRDDLCLANAVGVVDSDFRGQVKVKLTYHGIPTQRPDWPHVGDRVAQAKLTRLVKTELVQVDELDETERGENGFGSTGK